MQAYYSEMEPINIIIMMLLATASLISMGGLLFLWVAHKFNKPNDND